MNELLFEVSKYDADESMNQTIINMWNNIALNQVICDLINSKCNDGLICVLVNMYVEQYKIQLHEFITKLNDSNLSCSTKLVIIFGKDKLSGYYVKHTGEFNISNICISLSSCQQKWADNLQIIRKMLESEKQANSDPIQAVMFCCLKTRLEEIPKIVSLTSQEIC
jgi:hypothetical protein